MEYIEFAESPESPPVLDGLIAELGVFHQGSDLLGWRRHATFWSGYKKLLFSMVL